VVFLVTMGIAGGVPPVEGQSSVFIFDSFESGWSQWSQNPTTISLPRTTLIDDNSTYPTASAGSSAAQSVYPAGTLDGGGFGIANTGKATLPSHFLMEYDFKLSPSFHFPLGHKMWRAMPDFNTGALANDPTANLQLNNYGREWSLEIFSNSSVFGNKEYLLRPVISVPTTNVWHRVGIRVKQNTFTTSGTPNTNGELEVYYDGVSLGVLTGVRVTVDATRQLRDYWGGPGNYTSSVDNNPIPADQWIRIDNFKITDLTVGGAVPAGPSNVSVK
jgi:hypothetical protein